jgi:cysteine desulfurase
MRAAAGCALWRFQGSMKLPIYLDNHATTPLDPRVLEAMMPYLTNIFGNAASRNHSFGWEAEEAVEKGRKQVASLIGANAKEIVFTSGATESNNLALKGVAQMYAERGNHIITAASEHKAILDTCKHLEKDGCRVTYLPLKADGLVDLDMLKESFTDKTILVSIMYANNEIGVVQPIREIGAMCKERGILFHTDAVQAAGKIPVNVIADNIDLASISAHKLYGPKGVGALYVRRRNPRVQVTAQMDGGGHERGMRSGTLNVPGIVGLGAACEIAQCEMPEETVKLRALRDRLKDKLMSELDECYINGSWEHRLPHNLNISFAYVEGESLLMGINDIAVSSGSACTSATLEPSYVLKALGMGDDLAHSSIRFGIGRFNTQEEIDYTASRLIEVVNKLRELSPLYEMAKEGIDLSKVQWAAH